VPSKNFTSRVDVRTYSALFHRVKVNLLEGQRRIETEKIRTYWETGWYIQQHILQNNGRAEYGAQVIEKLSEDLDIAVSVLKECRTFASRYSSPPIGRDRGQLRWSHFRKLMSITDKNERAALEEATEKNAWSSDELISRIKGRRKAEDAEVTEIDHKTPATDQFIDPLISLRGQFYTYQIFKRKVLVTGTSELVLDLGFSNYRDVDQRLVSNFSAGDIVESKPRDDAYRFVKGSRTAKDLYTYQAYVEKVVDGDTLKVHIDLGFETWTRQTLRLRGIDCPELGTKDGEAAKAFVQSYFKEASQIILRSSRSDKYDRYLADVFIPQGGKPDPATDIFLNNFLLEKGHAEMWEG
jgi:endonuclease YncB( thermonuclease family)